MVAHETAPRLLHDGETLTLALTPERLGTLQVRIAFENGQAQVIIIAQSQEAVAALQQAETRLEEAFQRVGLELGHHGAHHAHDDGAPGRDQSNGPHDGQSSGPGAPETHSEEGVPFLAGTLAPGIYSNGGAPGINLLA
ncbi:MAG: flagellar hook-length control protein FliK [Pseudomonadota bacterium]